MALKTEFSGLDDPLLTPDQAATALNTEPSTLQVWRSTRRYDLPYVKIGGRVMYRLSAINTFIDSRTMQHTGMRGQS